MLIAAITGTDINLSAIPDLAAYVNQHHNFLAIGLANRLGPTVQASSSNTIQATLNRLKEAVDELKAVVAAGSPGPNEDLEDDLAKVWGALDDITEVLGGAVSAPIEPL